MTRRYEFVRGYSFYDVHCTRVLKHKFRAVCVALKHRKHFTEWITNQEIHKELVHPASLSGIWHFRHYRSCNLAVFAVAHLPSAISVKLCYAIGKVINWI